MYNKQINMIFVPRLLSRRRKRSNITTNKKTKRSQKRKTMTSRKVNGNYTIKKRRSRKNQNIKDGRDEDERWIIYTLEGCPCCTNAENMLKQHNKKVSCVEFKKLSFENQEKIKSIIIEQKPQFEMTYPRIFRVKNKKNDFIGGSSDLKKLIITQGI